MVSRSSFLSSVAVLVVLGVSVLQVGMVAPAQAKTSQFSELVAAGNRLTCAIRDGGRVLCWGKGSDGALGYGNKRNVGDSETPGSVGPVDLGTRPDGITPHTAKSVATGSSHACAVRDDGGVLCWGKGSSGQLGYGNEATVGTNETPGSVGPVDLGTRHDGSPHTAKSVTAGSAHTCAVRDDGRVLCWGWGAFGMLGYGNDIWVGTNQTPGSVGPVDLGTRRGGTPHTAKSVSAGHAHTCAVRDDGRVLCWGDGELGRLGYGNTQDVEGNQNRTPGDVGPVDLGTRDDGAPHTATSVTAGGNHTCAVRDDGRVLCWGKGENGRLGYGSRQNIGENNTPGSVGPVDLGTRKNGSPHTAESVTAGAQHTCAVRDDGRVLCWGSGENGVLGYGNTQDAGNTLDRTPGSVGPVNLGTRDDDAPHTAKSITAGTSHTCALRDDGHLLCWGFWVDGQLGYGNKWNVGDRFTPGRVGPVDIGGSVFRPFNQELAITVAPANTNALTRDIHVGDTVGIQITVWNRGPLSTGSQSIDINQILDADLLDITDIEVLAKGTSEEESDLLRQGIWKVDNLEAPKPPIRPKTSPIHDQAALLITAKAVKAGTQEFAVRYPNPVKVNPAKQKHTITIHQATSHGLGSV